MLPRFFRIMGSGVDNVENSVSASTESTPTANASTISRRLDQTREEQVATTNNSSAVDSGNFVFIPPDTEPSNWEEFLVLYFVKGEYHAVSKRQPVTCRHCNNVIPASRVSWANIRKHIYYSTRDPKDLPLVCARMGDEARNYAIKILDILDKVEEKQQNDTVVSLLNNENMSIDGSESLISSQRSSILQKTKMKGQTDLYCWAPKKFSDDETQKINLLIIRWFATSSIPFNAIDNKFARELFQFLRPGFVPVKRNSLTRTWLKIESDFVNEAVQGRILKEDLINISMDGWTDINYKSIYAILVSFPNDGREFLYSVIDASHERHTGEFVSRQFIDVVKKIGAQKICAIISDDAANMRLGRKMFIEHSRDHAKIFNVRCFMHAFSLVLESILKHYCAEDVISKAKTIVKYFKASHIPSALVRCAEQYFGRLRDKSTGLKTSNTTRLTSVQICCASVFNNSAVLQAIVGEYETHIKRDDVKEFIQDPIFWMELKELNNLMTPFAKCIMAIQGTKSRLSDVSRYWIYLTNHLQKYLEQPSTLLGRDGNFKLHIAQAFNTRSREIPINACSAALFLDPRFRQTVFQDESERTERLLESLFMIIAKQSKSSDEATILKLSELLRAYLKDEYPFNCFEYGGPDFDPRNWWENKCGPLSQVDLLATIAVRFFSIPTSAAGVERTFSLFDWIQAKRRNRLSIENLQRLAKIKQYHCKPIEAKKSPSKKRPREECNQATSSVSTPSALTVTPMMRSRLQTPSNDSSHQVNNINNSTSNTNNIIQGVNLLQSLNEVDAVVDRVESSDDEWSTDRDEDDQKNFPDYENEFQNPEEDNLTNDWGNSNEPHQQQQAGGVRLPTMRGRVTDNSYTGPNLSKLCWFDYSHQLFSPEKDLEQDSTVVPPRTVDLAVEASATTVGGNVLQDDAYYLRIFRANKNKNKNSDTTTLAASTNNNNVSSSDNNNNNNNNRRIPAANSSSARRK